MTCSRCSGERFVDVRVADLYTGPLIERHPCPDCTKFVAVSIETADLIVAVGEENLAALLRSAAASRASAEAARAHRKTNVGPIIRRRDEAIAAVPESVWAALDAWLATT